MFKNCMYCCYNRFMNVNDYALTITNYVGFQIYFVLQYTLKIGTKTRQSKILERGQSQKMYFAKTAQGVTFNVINNSSPTKELICNHIIGVPDRFYYFNVVETPQGIMCVQTKF